MTFFIKNRKSPTTETIKKKTKQGKIFTQKFSKSFYHAVSDDGGIVDGNDDEEEEEEDMVMYDARPPKRFTQGKDGRRERQENILF